MTPTASLARVPAHLMRRAVIAIAVLAVVVGGAAVAVGGSAPAGAATPATPYPGLVTKMVKKINKVREAEKLPALKLDRRLSAVAVPHSRLMARHHKYVTLFSGETTMAPRLRAYNYYPSSVGEALGSGRTAHSVLRRPVQLKSTSWASELDNTKSTVGVGVVHRGHRYWVTVVVSSPGTPTKAQLGSSYAQNLLQMLNSERRANGLPGLTMNADLIQSAHSHNLDMAAQNEMSHQLPGEAYFADRITDAGYKYEYAGENIGWNSVQTLDGVRQLESIMYNEKPPGDTGHRDNILSKNYTNVGIDVYFDDANGKVWLTEDFGKPAYW
jgi:uncharacterized protein YkwD